MQTSSTARRIFASFAGHLAIGTATGAVLGALAAREVPDASSMHIAFVALGGGIVGITLFATQSWHLRGPVRRIARWSLAGAAGGLVIAFALFDGSWRNPLQLLFAASTGACFLTTSGVRFMRDERGLQRSSTPMRERLIQLAFVLGTATLSAILLMTAFGTT